MFRLVTLNLNGIRSAANKGFVEWAQTAGADCMGVQEVRAQAADLAGRFDALGPLAGHFHLAQKKGYAGVGLYTHKEPSDVSAGFDKDEFDAEGRWLEARYDTPKRRFSVVSCYFPSGSSGEDRQAAKFRFLDRLYPQLMKLRSRTRVHSRRRREHRAPGNRLEELEEQPEEQRLPARRARLDDPSCWARAGWSMCSAS